MHYSIHLRQIFFNMCNTTLTIFKEFILYNNSIQHEKNFYERRTFIKQFDFSKDYLNKL